MEEFKFEPLAIRRTSDLIESRIKRYILDGKLKPGSRLPAEKKVAEQFGVSLVTLREALKSLETFGLIEKRKGKGGGVFISKMDNEYIKSSLGHYFRFKNLSPQHLYEVRKIIEPQVIKLVVQKISPEEIRRLEENVSYCEEKLSKVEQTISPEDFFDLDRNYNEFHTLIAEMTHNPILSLTVDYVFDFLKDCEAKLLVPDIKYCTDSAIDHRKILEYLKQKDVEKCKQEMALHLRRLDEYFLMILEKRSEK